MIYYVYIYMYTKILYVETFDWSDTLSQFLKRFLFCFGDLQAVTRFSPTVKPTFNGETEHLPRVRSIDSNLQVCREPDAGQLKGVFVSPCGYFMVFPKIGVGSPNHPVLIGFGTIINHPFWVPLFLETPMFPIWVRISSHCSIYD